MAVNRLSPGCGCCDPIIEWCNCSANYTFRARIEIEFLVDSFHTCSGGFTPAVTGELSDLLQLNGTYEFFFDRIGEDCDLLANTDIEEIIGQYNRYRVDTGLTTALDYTIDFFSTSTSIQIGRFFTGNAPAPNMGTHSWNYECDSPFLGEGGNLPSSPVPAADGEVGVNLHKGYGYRANVCAEDSRTWHVISIIVKYGRRR